jgi:predicted nucleic acid-binding protein
MGRRLILDSGILIAVERKQLSIGDLVAESDQAAVAAVTIAELRQGVELSTSQRHIATREAFIAQSIKSFEILEYTLRTTPCHARLMAASRKSGQTRGAIDLIIAAHAYETGRILVSTDFKAKFSDLPGITGIDVPLPPKPPAN